MLSTEKLIKLAKELYQYNSSFDDIAEVYTNINDCLEFVNDKERIVKLVLNGSVNLNDEYFYLTIYDKMFSCNKDEYFKYVEAQRKEIIDELKRLIEIENVKNEDLMKFYLQK